MRLSISWMPPFPRSTRASRTANPLPEGIPANSSKSGESLTPSAREYQLVRPAILWNEEWEGEQPNQTDEPSGSTKSEKGEVPRGISPFSVRTLRRPGFGYLSSASRCRRRARPESLRSRSPCAFRHRSPERAFPPSTEICSFPQISRNPGCPVFRGSSGHPALPEIRFRSHW
jgi:hypothetical protein